MADDTQPRIQLIGELRKEREAPEYVVFTGVERRWDKPSTEDRFIEPVSLTLNTGSGTGDVTDVQTLHDGNAYQVDEAASTPGFDLEFAFEGVRDIRAIVTNAYYTGLTGSHYLSVELYNYDTTTWDAFVTDGGSASYNYRTILLPNGYKYIDDSLNAVLRMYHPTAGNASHDLFVDYVALVW